MSYLEEFDCSPRGGKIYADGVFDLTHSGHFNAVRQASQLGDKLIIGIVSDIEAKGAKKSFPIFTQDERAEILKGCKWVDDVIVGTPYAVTLDFLKESGCDYVAHGDDYAVCGDGSDCYAEPRKNDKLRIFKRTQGVSTTMLIARLLLANRVLSYEMANNISSEDWKALTTQWPSTPTSVAVTTQRLASFIGVPKEPTASQKVVYVDGSFDVFHVGHLRTMQKAKELGDYLIVGIHDDETVTRVKGAPFPIQSLTERLMNVVAMRVVDQVVIGAPWEITRAFIQMHNISVVVSGTCIDSVGDNGPAGANVSECYRVPKEMSVYREFDSGTTLTTNEIMQRIDKNWHSLLDSIIERSRRQPIAAEGPLSVLSNEQDTPC